jgi:hypothetical protein
MIFELFVVSWLLIAFIVIRLERSQWYEGYKLNQLVKLINKFYGPTDTSPRAVLYADGSKLVGEPVDDLTITKFIQSTTHAASVGALGVLRTNLFETHRELLKLHPKAITLKYADVPGLWNTITYTYEFHTVHFYISQE